MHCEKFVIAVRAFTERQKPEQRNTKASPSDLPSPWSLVLDTETRIDPSQSLRFGFYQVREGSDLREEGVFHAPDLPRAEAELLRSYAERRGLVVRTRDAFIWRVFYPFGYELRGQIIGFNLPFDLSRLAIEHGEARGSLRGGFSFGLSPDKRLPRVRVKHLSRRAALIDFARPQGQLQSRGERRRNISAHPHRGFFIDLKTLAAALFSKSFSLASLCDHLETTTRKSATEEHGGPLTDDYVDYARRDVQATWECYERLAAHYAKHGLSKPAHRIFSEASLGKAYLEHMGVKPLLALRPDFPRAVFGKLMSAYYGGRAEVRIRREITRVHYCDFKSMYPTVNALMGLWRYVIASDLTERDGTEEVRRVLETVDKEALFDPATWPKLIAVARVKPDGDLLPVRAKYDGAMRTIGLNRLTCHEPLWFTLPDLIASKLLTGKTPQIEEAIVFEPGSPQADLRPITLFGDEGFTVDPAREDAFKRLVDLRDDAKAKRDDREKTIKILANATSYGIFLEVNRDDAPDGKPEPIALHDRHGNRQELRSEHLEEPGRYFNPALGVLITGAARLMLALAERLVMDEGLDWVFCDTDSIAIAKPEEMGEAEFAARCARVVAAFVALNPYAKPGFILQVEKVNFDPETGSPLPLFAFAISAKRYALFNIDEAGAPVLRKASAHGLGYLRAPYDASVPAETTPAPRRPLSELGVELWQHDLWVAIVAAALRGESNIVPLNYHPALQLPAVSRYGATSPRLLKWFESYNRNHPYDRQVKPFNFMLALQARNGLWAEAIDDEPLQHAPGRGRPTKTAYVNPVAPFEKDVAKAVPNTFDRETGKSVAPEMLKTFADALAQYHLSPEAKFANGSFMDRGRTARRHVLATGVQLIGKEGNRITDDAPAGLDGRDVAEFGERRTR